MLYWALKYCICVSVFWPQHTCGNAIVIVTMLIIVVTEIIVVVLLRVVRGVKW